VRARVMVVDDEQTSRMLLTDFLSDSGFDVECAPDCRTALRLASGSSFAIAILDLNLPDGSGLDLLRRLREGRPGLKAFFLSGTPSDEVLRECAHRGLSVDGCVTKPFSLTVLHELLAAALARP
jgi:DNA-binding response OmpR family regulator